MTCRYIAWRHRQANHVRLPDTVNRAMSTPEGSTATGAA